MVPPRNGQINQGHSCDRRWLLFGDDPDQFSLAPLTGTGTVEWRVSPAGQRVGVHEFRALLIGRDGAVIALAGAEGRATALVGEYRLDSLALTLNGRTAVFRNGRGMV